jgi:ribosome biogenesis GTPase
MFDHLLSLPFDRLGLKPCFLRELLGEHDGKLPWRVASVDRGSCALLGIDAASAIVSRRARPPESSIAVGDWVVLEDESVEPPRIGSILPRSTRLRRGATARDGHEQLLAANLDTVFVVSAFAEASKLERRGINARRIERYVAAVREGGIVPVVLLNKVDLSARDADGLQAITSELASRLGHEVLCTSATHDRGLDALQSYLPPGDTVALIGMSGVGKSSLINALVGEERLKVTEVRDEDRKGRHTTTRRELLVMPSGSLLIDTPGMRQFAVLTETGELPGFDDIEALAAECKFSDCEHESEPGCRVRAAVEQGDLSADRLQSYHSIKRDAQRLRSRHDAFARHQERQEARRFGRLVRRTVAEKKR